LGKINYAYPFAICTALAIWTKQVTFFMLPVYFCYILFSGKHKLLYKKETLFSFCLLAVMISPFLIISLKYAVLNLGSLQGSPLTRVNAGRLTYHLEALYSSHLILPVLGLAIVSIVGGIFTRDRRSLLFYLWIILCYLQMTYLRAFFARHTIYWIPPFCLFAALSMEYIHLKFSKKYFINALMFILCAYQFSVSYQVSPPQLKGFEEAARFVIDHRKGNAVFFEGYMDPVMVFFIRKNDKTRDMILLRGSKLLATSAMRRTISERVTSEDEIVDIFRRFGVKYIVVEDESYEKVGVYMKLRKLLKSDDFDLKKEIVVEIPKGGANYFPKKLLIYEYKGDGIPAGGKLSMELPIVGQKIELPIDRIRISRQ
jgi:hypothetical protein